MSAEDQAAEFIEIAKGASEIALRATKVTAELKAAHRALAIAQEALQQIAELGHKPANTIAVAAMREIVAVLQENTGGDE